MVCKYYKEFNPNPKKLHAGDCVVRALCAVTGKDWYEIFDLLVRIARENCVMPNEGDTKFDELVLTEFGFKRCKLTRQKGKKAMNVERFCKEHPTGRYVLRCAHHLMGVVDGLYWELLPGWEDSTVYTYYEECNE